MSKYGRNPSEIAKLQQIDHLRLFDLWDWVGWLQGEVIGGHEIYEVRITASTQGDDPLLMVIKAWDTEGAPVVGFHGGGHILEMLASAARRVRNGTIKWRADEYARSRDS
jgi:hypothetical protein